MNFIHDKLGDCTNTELDLFSVPLTQVSLEKGLWVDHQPVSSVSDAGPIRFVCPGIEDYTNLSKTILVVRPKVIKADRTSLDAGEKVGICEQFPAQFVQTSRCVFERKTSDPSKRNVAYRAYLETNYGPAAKWSQLAAAMFYKDTVGKMDAADPTAAAANANLGLKERYVFSHKSGILEMAGPLFCDVFRSERLPEFCRSQSNFES